MTETGARTAESGPIPTGAVPSTRQRLLEVAFELLLEQGYRDTTVQAVARRAGLTIGAIYANFANKHHLLAEAALRAMDHAAATELLENTDMTIRGLGDLLALQMSMPATSQHRLLTEITGASMREMKEDSPILQHLHNMADLARAWIVSAQISGELDPALAPEPLVNHFVALILGSVTTKSLGLPQPDFAASREMIQRVLDALAPPRDGAAAMTAAARDEG
jgi:AcrR family transcriptional regulator